MKGFFSIFEINRRGEPVFRFGREDWTMAQATASKCGFYSIDVDNELIKDIMKRSCYNCAYRKWIKDTFICTQWKNGRWKKRNREL